MSYRVRGYRTERLVRLLRLTRVELRAMAGQTPVSATIRPSARASRIAA
jgi:hypothetical protein